jgi:hypothetical protein
MDATEDGRDGKSCESLSEPPEVFLRVRGGRAPTDGEPARRASGTLSTDGLLVVLGEPIWRGEGTPSMLSQGWMLLCDRLNIGPDGDDGQSQISKYRSQQSDHRNQLVRFADSSRYARPNGTIFGPPPRLRMPCSQSVSSLSLTPSQPAALPSTNSVT